MNAISCVEFDAAGVLSPKIQDNLANAVEEGIAEIRFAVCSSFLTGSRKVKVIAKDKFGSDWIVGFVPKPFAGLIAKTIDSGGSVHAASWEVRLGRKMNYKLRICANICTGDYAIMLSQQF